MAGALAIPDTKHEISCGRHCCPPSFAACSLHETLAPRWQFFTLLAARQPGFKAEDHLAALATLPDQEFAQVHNNVDLNIVFDKSF